MNHATIVNTLLVKNDPKKKITRPHKTSYVLNSNDNNVDVNAHEKERFYVDNSAKALVVLLC